MLYLQILLGQFSPQPKNELLGVLIDQLPHDFDDLVRVGARKQLFLDEGDEFLLDRAHVFVAALLQERTNIPL